MSTDYRVEKMVTYQMPSGTIVNNVRVLVGEIDFISALEICRTAQLNTSESRELGDNVYIDSTIYVAKEPTA